MGGHHCTRSFAQLGQLGVALALADGGQRRHSGQKRHSASLGVGSLPLWCELMGAASACFSTCGRNRQVLGFTKQGQPRHPLYARAGTNPQAWGILG
jgi:hypothetical protein